MKLTDSQARPVLKKIASEMKAKLLTRASIMKEFLAHRIALLKSHTMPLWEYTSVEDAVRLRVPSLTGEELDVALVALLGVSPEDILDIAAPL